MKILSVRFKNINSLKGEFSIDFEASPLSDSSLFAITGPTGSGKTTILDAIIVALYNRVPRHEGNVSELMSRHTGDCYSEVVFQSGEKTYCSKWSLNRARNKPDGALQQDKMELSFVSTGEIIGSHRKTDTLKEIVEITGLDYEQFLRSVMLSQGEFSKFLKAKPPERSSLLEQMTGTRVFSEISTFIFEKTKSEKQKLEALDAILGQFTVMSHEAMAETLIELNTTGEQVTELKKAENNIRIQSGWWKEEETLNLKKQSLLEQMQALSLKKQEAFSDLAKLSLHQKAVPFLPLFEKLDELNGNLQKQSEELVKLDDALNKVKSNREEAEKDSLKANYLLNAILEQIKKEMPALEKAIDLDKNLLQKNQEKENLELIKKNEKIQLEEAKTKQEKIKEDLQQLEKSLEEINKWLLDQEVLKGLEEKDSEHLLQISEYRQLRQQVLQLEKNNSKDKAELEELEKKSGALKDQNAEAIQEEENLQKQLKETVLRIEQLDIQEAEIRNQVRKYPELLSGAKSCLDISQSFLDLQKEIETQQQEKEETEIKKTGIFEKGSQAKIRLEEAEAHLAALQKIYEHEALILKYEADRHLLEDGKPCPLCGALHHPYEEASGVPVLQDAKKAVDDQVKKTALLREEKQELLIQFREKELDIKSLAGKLLEWQNRLEIQIKNFDNQKKQHGLGFDIADGKAIKEYLEESIDRYKVLQEKLLLWEKLQEQLRKQEKALVDFKHQIKLNAANLEALENAVLKTKGQVKQTEDSLAALDLQQKNIGANLKVMMEDFGLTWDAKNPDGSRENWIQLNKTFQQKTKEKEQLQKDRDLLQKDLEHTGQISGDLEKRIKGLEESISILGKLVAKIEEERIGLIGDRNPIAEKRHLLDSEEKLRAEEKESNNRLQEVKNQETGYAKEKEGLERSLKGLKEQIDVIKLKLGKVAIEAGFDHVDALQSALLPADIASGLVGLQKDLEQQTHKIMTLQKENEEAFTALAEKGKPELSKAKVEEALEKVETDLDRLQQQLGAISRRLEEDKRLKKEFADKVAEQQIQQQVFHRWQNLNALIGSSDGNKFRSFAQGLTLRHLAMLANRHLQTFSSRYNLIKSEGDNLELEIKDAWQADIIRPISTLSGGETFLVSLALALGLSDLASKKVQIKSLFIDEGFGTLDAETLDVAMDALENLREAGKSIGVISHVEAMKERIRTQIQVHRTSGGYSRLEVKVG